MNVAATPNKPPKSGTHEGVFFFRTAPCHKIVAWEMARHTNRNAKIDPRIHLGRIV